MGKFATAFRGVWGRVVKVEQNEAKYVKIGDRVILDGRDYTEIYILSELPLHNGRRTVIKASPYELDGGLLDERPVIHTERREVRYE